MTSHTASPGVTTHPTPPSNQPGRRIRRTARIAGVSYVLMFALAILANFLVLEGLVVQDDPLATTANIADSPALLRTGILAFLFIVLLDIVLA